MAQAMRVMINLRLDAEDRTAFALSLGMEKFDAPMSRAWAKNEIMTAVGDMRADELGEGREDEPKEEIP